MAGLCTGEHGRTIFVNHFEDAGDDMTRWTACTNRFFKGMIRLMYIFLAGSTREHTESGLQRFELVVESSETGLTA
jgi:hypothetical protein